MKLLDNIFAANESFDPFFVTSYLTQIVTTYLTEFHSPSPLNKKMARFLNPLPIDDPFNQTSRLMESTITEIIAWQERAQQLQTDEQPAHPEKAFPMEMKHLRRLVKVFVDIPSISIKKLLRLLDHSRPKVRRLTVALLQILLKSRPAKRRLIDKCGLGSGPGLIMLNRFKDLVWDRRNEMVLFLLLRQLNQFIKRVERQMAKNRLLVRGIRRFGLTGRLFLGVFV